MAGWTSALFASRFAQETQGHPKPVLRHSALGSWPAGKGDFQAPRPLSRPKAWQLLPFLSRTFVIPAHLSAFHFPQQGII